MSLNIERLRNARNGLDTTLLLACACGAGFFGCAARPAAQSSNVAKPAAAIAPVQSKPVAPVKSTPTSKPEPASEFEVIAAARPLTQEETAALVDLVKGRVAPFTWNEVITPSPAEPSKPTESGDVVLNSFSGSQPAGGGLRTELRTSGLRIVSLTRIRADNHTMMMKQIIDDAAPGVQRVVLFDKLGVITVLDDYEGNIGTQILDMVHPDKASEVGFSVIRLGDETTRDAYERKGGAWSLTRYKVKTHREPAAGK